MAITRTIEFDDFTPAELAAMFCEMGSIDQVEFFRAIWKIAAAWPGAGWCQQSYSIAQNMNGEARNTIETLASHVLDDGDDA